MPEIPSYPTLAVPAVGDELVIVDVSDTSAAPTGTVKKTTPALLLGVASYYFPSGDNTGATDTAAINAVIGAGDACVLAWTGTNFSGGETPYYVSAPLTPATGSSLTGAAPAMASNGDNYGSGVGGSSGTVIYVLPAFSGAGVISMTNATASQYYGVTLKDFSLEMYASPAGHGVLVDGAWGACVMEGVNVNGAFADGLHFQADATTSKGPDDWRVAFCKFNGALGYGVWADNLPDSWFIGCEASACAKDGWWLGFSLNTRLVGGCKGENNGQAGLHLTGQGGVGRALQVSDFTTHLNQQDGILCDGTSSGSVAGGVYLLSNCVCIDDGQAGGTTYAGIRASGSVNKVQGSNIVSVGAPNGASQVSTSNGMDFIHSSFTGTTLSLNDDGSNATQLVNRESADGQRATLRTAFNSSTGTSAQNVTGMAVTLPVGTWKLKGWFPCTFHGTDGSTQLFAFTFGGTTTAAAVKWTSVSSGTTATFATGTSLTTATTALTMSATGIFVEFDAVATVSVAGALQLTVKSGTSGDEVTVPAGSYLDVTPP